MSNNTSEHKLADFFAKVGKRNVMIAAAVVLIAGAVLLNWAFFAAGQKAGYDYGKGTGTDATQTGEKATDAADAAKDTVAEYYSSVQVSRQRARDEALEVLQSVVDSAQADTTVKNEALAEIAVIASEIEKEANIETLVESKGFANCVAVLNGDKANIIVTTKDNTELNAAQLAQINEIVYTQTQILPAGITIVRK